MATHRSSDNAFVQKKSLSQVFLRESWPCARVAAQLRQLGVTRALEIGPGAGIMTIELLKAGINVWAVEKDSRLIDQLNDLGRYAAEQDPRAGRLTVINQDILKFDLGLWLKESQERTAVAGNIPYSISSPILMWVLPHIRKVAAAFLLVQFEFAVRLAAKAGTKDYGSITVFTQLRAHVNLEFKVDKTLFKPVPKVDSAMISITGNNAPYPEGLLDVTERFTRISFMQRRKKLRNGVKSMLKDLNESEFPVDLDRRAETLTPEEFVQCGEFIMRRQDQV